VANGKFVIYYRVSTAKQEKSGLGLQAQVDAVHKWLDGGSWKIVGEFTEIESGKSIKRPQLAEALKMCRISNATLLVAKQDRLSRKTAQIMGMLDKGQVPFVCVDDPNTTKLNVGIKALIAEDEADKASSRTIAALAVARANGKQLGGKRGDWSVGTVSAQGHAASLEARRATAAEHRADLKVVLEDIQSSGITTLLGIAKELNNRGFATPRQYGKDNPRESKWSAVQVSRFLARI
jgi:DNA invertase Pin-like site-specific DNA recombinase